MATVALATVWLNLASDLSDYQSFSFMSDLEVTPEVDGEARRYAGGRIRLVRKGNLTHSFHISLPSCTRTQVEWLTTNTGQLMLVRDDRGRKVWGVYFKAPTIEISGEDCADVTIDFVEITHSEAL
jgi:hypothetical protein